jgi:hypothetical protein
MPLVVDGEKVEQQYRRFMKSLRRDIRIFRIVGIVMMTVGILGPVILFINSKTMNGSKLLKSYQEPAFWACPDCGEAHALLVYLSPTRAYPLMESKESKKRGFWDPSKAKIKGWHIYFRCVKCDIGWVMEAPPCTEEAKARWLQVATLIGNHKLRTEADCRHAEAITAIGQWRSKHEAPEAAPKPEPQQQNTEESDGDN